MRGEERRGEERMGLIFFFLFFLDEIGLNADGFWGGGGGLGGLGGLGGEMLGGVGPVRGGFFFGGEERRGEVPDRQTDVYVFMI